jgi:hypothetical protein
MAMREIQTSGGTRAWKTARHALLLAEGVVAAVAAAKTTVNSGAIPNANPMIAPAATDLTAAPSGYKRYKLSGAVFFRAAAVDTAFVCQFIQDPAGVAAVVGPAFTVDSSHVNANGFCALPEIIVPAPGSGALKWAIRVSSAGTNAQVLAANEASVTVTPLPA